MHCPNCMRKFTNKDLRARIMAYDENQVDVAFLCPDCGKEVFIIIKQEDFYPFKGTMGVPSGEGQRPGATRAGM